MALGVNDRQCVLWYGGDKVQGLVSGLAAHRSVPVPLTHSRQQKQTVLTLLHSIPDDLIVELAHNRVD